jgi:triacylglycerol lipase
MRGARGIEFGVDLPNISALSPDWSFRDWSRFSSFWAKEAKKHSDSKTREDRTLASAGSAAERSAIQHLAIEKRTREQEKELAQDNDVVKSSTDKLSAVMDWLVEQGPSTPKLSLNGGEVSIGVLGNGISRPEERVEEKPKLKSDLETKEELERFYIALCRKIYEEGL